MPGVATRFVGAPGAVAAVVMALDDADGPLSKFPRTPTTWKVVVPGNSPVTVAPEVKLGTVRVMIPSVRTSRSKLVAASTGATAVPAVKLTLADRPVRRVAVTLV